MKLGLYDAGLGGISVLNAVYSEFPFLDYIFLADNHHFPYYPKTHQQLDEIALRNCEFLIKLGCEIVIIACNTSTVTSLGVVQKMYPTITIIGTTPPIKRAAEATKTGHFGVLSTPKTQNSQPLKNQIGKYAPNLIVHNLASPRLSLLIETGSIDNAEIMQEMRCCLEPVLKDDQVDVLAIGCTHYSLVKSAMKRVFPRDIQIIHSSEDITEQVRNSIKARIRDQKNKGEKQYYTSGNPENLNRTCQTLFEDVEFHPARDW